MKIDSNDGKSHIRVFVALPVVLAVAVGYVLGVLERVPKVPGVH